MDGRTAVIIVIRVNADKTFYVIATDKNKSNWRHSESPASAGSEES